MAITDADIGIYLTVKTGSAGNSTAGTAAGSLGKYLSTTAAPTGLHAIFDTISAAENAASTVDYRCLAVRNLSATDTVTAVAFLPVATAGGATLSIQVDTTPATAIGSASAQGLSIANETTAPAGVTGWSTGDSASTGVDLGTIPPAHCRLLWLKRAANASPALDPDGATLRVAFTGA